MGAVRISMVELEKVTQFFPQKRETLSEFKSIESAYIEGMKVILREIATKRCLELMGPRSTNLEIIEASDNVSKIFDQLYNVLDNDKLKLLGKVEEAYNHLHGLEQEESFVLGFLEGYRFIKEIQKSGGGVTLEM